jgi:hypothetical protein
MLSFWCAVAAICAVQVLNLSLFLGGAYSSQGVILADSVFLSLLALVCSVEVSTQPPTSLNGHHHHMQLT